MSWLEKNYEKAAVGGAAIAALGFAALGYLKVSGVPEDFSVQIAGSGPSEIAVKDAGLVAKAIASNSRKLEVPERDVEGQPVDILTGVPLFIHRDNPNVIINLYTAPPVHPPIPNKWWIEYRLDPGYADSPQRDADSDGYSNLEEFAAKTSPIDPKDHPSLLDKLKFIDLAAESIEWSLRPGFPSADGKLSFKYYEKDRPLDPKNKNAVGVELAPGDMFFATEPLKNRFKFLGLEKVRERNSRLNIDEDVTYARIEDQRPNKKGTVYRIPAPLQESRVWDLSKHDRSADFSLEAAGHEGKIETVPENTKFGLPFDSKEKNYLLKTVTPTQVEVEYTDPKTGEKTTVTIEKGSFPTKKP